MSTSVVGIVGIAAAYLGGRGQQATALAVAKQQVDAQVAVAREERQQRRPETAYMELLQALSHMYEWVKTVSRCSLRRTRSTRCHRCRSGPTGPKADALITAYWSPRIQQFVDEWNGAVVEVHNIGAAIGIAQRSEDRGHDSGIDAAELTKQLPGAKEAAWTADQRIRDQVRLELLGQHDGRAEYNS